MSEQHNAKLIDELSRRLQVLEQQKARFGSLTPPHIVLEIEDIQQQIQGVLNDFVGSIQSPSSPGNSASPAVVNNYGRVIQNVSVNGSTNTTIVGEQIRSDTTRKKTD